MNELENSFRLLKKSISKNREIKEIFIDAFSKLDYKFFSDELFPEWKEERSWEKTVFEVSKEIINKDLFLFASPAEEFEIKLQSIFYIDFLPDLKFAVDFRKQIENVTLHFNKNGFVSVFGNEGEKKFSTILCPKDNFYNLLSLISLLMNIGACDEDNLKLIMSYFPDDCFFYKTSECVLENIEAVKTISKGITQEISNNFFLKNGTIYFPSIINQEDVTKSYTLSDFYKKGFSLNYSFVINDFLNEFEFFFKELNDLNKKRVYNNVRDENLKELIPMFIRVYKIRNKKNPYQICFDYGDNEKKKDFITLSYNVKENKLEEENSDTSELYVKRVNALLSCDVVKSFFPNVEKTLTEFCTFAKKQDKNMFEPLNEYFALIKKILVNSCATRLLVARI